MNKQIGLVKGVIRDTSQRKLIRQILSESRDHPDVNEIYVRARKLNPKISLGTVYRNLKILMEQDLVKDIPQGNLKRYDGDMDDHLHFICDSCHNIIDLKIPELSSAINDLLSSVYRINEVKLEVHGICNDCRKRSA